MTIRCLNGSVNATTPSGTSSPPLVFVCWKSDWDAYRMIGFRQTNTSGGEEVPPLGHPRGVQRRRPLGRIVVDLEVLGLDDPEIEGLVLDLVLPEVLRCER